MKTLARSFAGGVITPEAWGRVDLTKYQTGVAEALNFEVLPHGPLRSRPGFVFGAEVRDSTRLVRLIPFAFAADQTLQIEAGHLYFRFHVAGQVLLEPNRAISSIVGNAVTMAAPHTWSSGDDVYIGGRPLRVTVTGAATFTVADRWGAAVTPVGTVAARVYTLPTPYDEASLFGLRFAQDSDVLTLTSRAHAARELRRLGPTSWALTVIDFAATGTPPGAVSVTPTIGTPGNQSPQAYCVTAIGADGVTETLASAVVSTNNNLSIAGNFNTLAWGAVAGATRYYAYKRRGGAFGYIGQTTALSLVDDNVLPDLNKTPPEAIFTLNNVAGAYPVAVTYYEGRRWFAGTSQRPQTFWATRSGTESNLTSSIPLQDDDAIQQTVKAQQQNAIQHLVPLTDVLALTVGGEFRIFADGAPVITPESLSIKPQGFMGSAEVQPALTSASVLYVQAQGGRVRELAYNDRKLGFASIDICIMAPNLFDGFQVVDMAYVRAPVPMLWAVRSDGALLCMTYVPEQEVFGWTLHQTDGVVESVSAVPEGDEDVLSLVIRRTVNGRTVRYVERRASSFSYYGPQEDCFFVDSGLTYRGAPATLISGLWHLEGAQVQVLADGGVHPVRTVTAGAIELEGPAEVVHVGLGYVSRMKTLPLAVELEAAGQGRTKNINTVALRLARSTVFRAGPSFAPTDMIEAEDRSVEDDFDSPPALRTEVLELDVMPSWTLDASLCVERYTPLPLTVLSMALDVAVSD